jgi:hypothetical protein
VEWFREQLQYISIFQIMLDIGLIAALFFFLRKRSKYLKGAEDLSVSLEKIIEETRIIAGQFDANLNERQALLHQIMTKLDQQIQEAQRMCKQLGALKNEVQLQSSQSQIPTPRLSEQQEIVQLARKGFDAEAIAKRLHKPVGEIELILNLQRLSSGR